MDHENLLIAGTQGQGDASLRQSSVCPVADPRQEMRPFAKALHVRLQTRSRLEFVVAVHKVLKYRT